MPNKLNNPHFPTLPRLAQDNIYYCGPAVLQMLLSYLGHTISQENLVDAAGVTDKIRLHGMTISEMSLAVSRLFPQLQFWYKFESSLADLSQIINNYHYPVGIEWQGLFDWPDDDEDEYYDDDDDDAGHYSIITHIDTQENIVLIADPEKHYAGKDRRFTILSFEHRWWDINSITDPNTGKVQEIDDNHPCFIITPTDTYFPETLHMVRA